MNRSAGDGASLLPNPLPTGASDRLLLFAIRRVASCGLNDAHAANAFLTAFGLGYRRPLVLLRALMAEMSRASSLRIMIAPCCCRRMTAAEAAMMGAIGSAGDDPPGAHAALRRVLGVHNCLGALASAQALGQAFADLGRPLARDLGEPASC